MRAIDFANDESEPSSPVNYTPLCCISAFINNSAVESDAQGGDVISAASSPDDVALVGMSFPDKTNLFSPSPRPPVRKNFKSTPLPSQIRHPASPRRFVPPKLRSKPLSVAEVKKIKKRQYITLFLVCDLCDKHLRSSNQLKQHRNSKKCRNHVAYRDSNPNFLTFSCKRKFDTIYNLHLHNFTKNHK
eukprot:IDg22652t1